MQLVVAIVQPFRLEDVKTALGEAGATGMTVTEVKGFGHQKGHREIYRGAEYATSFTPKIKVEVVVAADRVDAIVDAILRSAFTGQIGDGKIFVIDVGRTVRIRTGEVGEAAL